MNEIEEVEVYYGGEKCLEWKWTCEVCKYNTQSAFKFIVKIKRFLHHWFGRAVEDN